MNKRFLMIIGLFLCVHTTVLPYKYYVIPENKKELKRVALVSVGGVCLVLACKARVDAEATSAIMLASLGSGALLEEAQDAMPENSDAKKYLKLGRDGALIIGTVLATCSSNKVMSESGLNFADRAVCNLPAYGVVINRGNAIYETATENYKKRKKDKYWDDWDEQ